MKKDLYITIIAFLYSKKNGERSRPSTPLLATP